MIGEVISDERVELLDGLLSEGPNEHVQDTTLGLEDVRGVEMIPESYGALAVVAAEQPANKSTMLVSFTRTIVH